MIFAALARRQRRKRAELEAAAMSLHLQLAIYEAIVTIARHVDAPASATPDLAPVRESVKRTVGMLGSAASEL